MRAIVLRIYHLLEGIVTNHIEAILHAASPSATNVFATIKEGSPVNAVAANKVLTVSNTPSEGDTVSMGGIAYKYRAAIGAGDFAAITLTTTDLFHEGDIIIFGGVEFKITATLSDPNDVLLETTLGPTVDNLVSAFNGTAGEGTKYATDTVNITSEQFLAGKGNGDTFVVAAKVRGFESNDVSVGGTMEHSTWGGLETAGGIDPQAANDVLIGNNAEAAIDNLVLAITGGTNEGVKYGTGTIENPLATAVKATAATMTATNIIKGVIGNDTVIAKSGANLSWAGSAVKLSGGVNGTIGLAPQLMWDGSYLYICSDDNTIADANWKKATLA